MAADSSGSLSGGAYRHPDTVVRSRPENFEETDPAPYPADTGINHNAGTKVYDPHSQAGESQVTTADELEPVDAPAHAPSHWAPGKDVYKNNGVTGQEFFNNVDHQEE